MSQPGPALTPGRVIDLANLPLNDPGKVTALTFSAQGELFALESGGQRVLRFSRRGDFLESAGGFGFADGSTRGAHDIASAGFEIWVSDPPGGRIVRFNRRLAPLPSFSSTLKGTAEILFERPASVARAASGDIVLLERDRPELLLIDPEGRLIERVAGFGDAGPIMRDPHRLRIAPDSRITLCDPGSKRLLFFDRFGSPAGEWSWPLKGGGPYGVAFDGSTFWVCGEGGLVACDETGEILLQLGHETTGGAVRDIAIGGDLLVLATDPGLRFFSRSPVR